MNNQQITEVVERVLTDYSSIKGTIMSKDKETIYDSCYKILVYEGIKDFIQESIESTDLIETYKEMSMNEYKGNIVFEIADIIMNDSRFVCDNVIKEAINGYCKKFITEKRGVAKNT